MKQSMTAERREALSGTTRSMVVFLHGYGANGADLLGLADHLAETMPDTLFVSPNAPHACRSYPGGYQWFPLPPYDAATPVQFGLALQESIHHLELLLKAEAEDAGVGLNDVVLFGFSQGAMMALEMAPRINPRLAAVVGFAGALFNDVPTDPATSSRPPIMLGHDKDDPIVPYAALDEAATALEKAGFRVYTYTSSGFEHELSPIGIGAALHFMVRELG